MARAKSKDTLLAEIAYRDGRTDALTTEGIVDLDHEDEIVEAGAALSLKKWKEQTGGKKPQPSDIQIARKEWIAKGKPPEGIRQRTGTWFIFKKTDDEQDGEYDVTASLMKNFRE
jgi:hypothetical protein